MANQRFERGQRVLVDGNRPGTVSYIRMAPPDFREPAAVSIVMDDLKMRPRYEGSVFPAERVSVLGSAGPVAVSDAERFAFFLPEMR